MCVTTEQAASAIRGSRSKIARIESGQVGFKERDIEDLLALYGFTGPEEREELLQLAREANAPGWWQEYSGILPHWVKQYFGLEAAAAFIRCYELQFVPGLLQTEAYAREIFRLGGAVSDEEVTRRVEARLTRQDILNREDPPRLWAVIDEGALQRPLAGRSVVQEQIRHLINMADHPAVTLQVLPFRTGRHPAMGGGFTILRFTEFDLRDVVYMEQLTSAIYLYKDSDVDTYIEVMEQLCLQAEPVAETQKLLSEVLNVI